MLSSHVRRVLTGLHTKRFVLFCFCFRLLFFFSSRFSDAKRNEESGAPRLPSIAVLKNANRNKITGDMQAKKSDFCMTLKNGFGEYSLFVLSANCNG